MGVERTALVTITKNDLCARVAHKFGLPSTEVKPVVEAFLEEILLVMREGQRIEIRGFGTFKVSERKAQICRNPRTGEVAPVPSRKSPMFRFYKDAHNILNRDDYKPELRKKRRGTRTR